MGEAFGKGVVKESGSHQDEGKCRKGVPEGHAGGEGSGASGPFHITIGRGLRERSLLPLRYGSIYARRHHPLWSAGGGHEHPPHWCRCRNSCPKPFPPGESGRGPHRRGKPADKEGKTPWGSGRSGVP